MNHVYRIVFNLHLGVWQAVTECARGKGKTRSSREASPVALAAVLAGRGLCASPRLVAVIAALVAASGMQPAMAQASVSTTGNVNPGVATSPVWDVGGELRVGETGTGTLSILDGGKVTNTTAYVGANGGSQGAVTVSGKSSLWTSSGLLLVGFQGAGTLDIQAGGQVLSGMAFIGGHVGSVGKVTVNGANSKWTSSQQMSVGDNGTGELDVLGGGEVASDGVALIGRMSGAQGTVRVDGSGAKWSHQGYFGLGEHGVGVLDIQRGGVVQASSVVLGIQATGKGTLHLRGDATNGRGTLATGSVAVGAGAGTLDLDGGILRATANSSDFLQNTPSLTLGAGGAFFDTNGHDITIGTSFASGKGQSSGLVKQGSGTLRLTGASTYTGGTTVDAGMLAIGNMGALGSGVVRLNNGAELLSTVSGTGGFAQLESGDGRVSAAAGTSFEVPGITAVRGTLRIGSGANTGTVSLSSFRGGLYEPLFNLAVDHGTFRYGDVGPAELLTSGNGRLTVAAGATADLNGLSVQTTFLDGAGRIESQKAGAATLTVGTSWLPPAPAGDSAFSGVIADGAGVVSLIKEASNTLTLVGANTYTGGTTVAAGTLRAGSADAFVQNSAYAVNGGTLDLGGWDLAASSLAGSSGTVALGSRTLSVGSANTSTTFAGAITGTNGKLVKNGTGTLTLTGTSTYSGGSEINAGAVRINNGLALGTGAVIVNGAQLSGTADLTLANTYLGFSGSSMVGAAAGTTLTLRPSTLFLGSGVQFVVGSATETGIVAVSRNASGVGLPSGTLRVAGGTLLDQGNGGASALSFFTQYISRTTVDAGATLDFNGYSATVSNLHGAGRVLTGSSGPSVLSISEGNFAGAISGLGMLVKEGTGTDTLTLAGTNTYTGGTMVRAGTLRAGSAGAFVQNSAYTVQGGTLDLGSWDLSASSFMGFDVGGIVALNARRLTVNQSVNTSYVGIITGTGGTLLKEGTGTLNLLGANTYTGGTTINAGTLAVNGSVAGNVQVNSGGTLVGTGTVAGNVVVASGATLSPGNSPGTLTIGGDLTLGSGSTTVFELGQSGAVGGVSNDLVNVGGNLTLGGTLRATASSAGWYRLFDYGVGNPATTLSGSFGSTNVTGTSGFTTASHQISTTVPGPGVPGQVNLSVLGAGQSLQFWNGSVTTSGGLELVGGAGTWDGFGTNWSVANGSTAGNWLGSVAVFAGPAGGTVTVQGPQSFDTLQFATDGYSLGAGVGGALAIAPATGGKATINTDAGISASIAAALTNGSGGGNGLVKVGSGTLTLSGANTYTGGTAINEGTLIAASNGALGTGAVTVDNSANRAATLRVDAGVSPANTIVLNNGATLDNAGSIVRNGAGGFAVASVRGGATVHNTGGSLSATGNGGMGVDIDARGGAALGVVNNTSGGLITANVAGVRILGAGSVTNNASTISANGNGGMGVEIVAGTGTVVNQNGSLIEGQGFGVALSDGGSITNAGSVIRATGAGPLAVGAIVAGGAGSISNTGAGSTIQGGAAGVRLVDGGSITNGAGATIEGALAVHVINGNATLSNAGNLLGDVQLNANGVHQVTLFAGSRLAGQLDIGASAASTLTLDGVGTQDYSQAVTGATTFTGALVKNGSGNWALDRALTPVSATVNAGTLALSGAGQLAATGAVRLAGNTAVFDISAANGNRTIGALSGVAGSTVALGARSLSVGDDSADTTFAGAITGTGALVKQGSKTLTLTSASTFSGGTALKQGRINLGHNTALGGGELAMDDGTTLGFAADGLTIANAIRMTGNNDPVIDTGSFSQTISGAISGGGFLTKEGTGTLTLSGANSYTGATEVARGTLRAGTVNTLSAASVHTVAAGATLDLAGFSQRVAGLTNAGTVNLQGSTPGTVLTVTGPWIGNGGTLALGTVLGGNGSPSDKVMLSGASAVASGTTKVQITNLGGLGARTTGNGIEVVGTEGGARIQDQAFALAAPVAAGAYEYQLNTTSSGAYLSNSLPTPDPVLPSTVSTVPTYRAEVPLYAALPEQLRQANLAMLGSMHQRMGDDGAGSVRGADAEQGRRQAWGRVLTVDREIRQGGTVSPSSEGRLAGFQAGTDLWDDPNWRAGLYVGQLEGDMRVNGFARGIPGYAAGRNDLRNEYLGGYLTYRTDNGLYVDGVLQAGRHRSTVDTVAPSLGGGGKGNSLLASIELGQAFALGAGWSAEPQLQLVHQRLSLDDGAIAGAQVQQDTPSNWAVRAGLRVKGEFAVSTGTLQAYARLNVWHRKSGTDRTRFIGPAAFADIVTPTGGSSTEAAVGVTWQISPMLGVYGEVGQLWGPGGTTRAEGGPNASLGVKVRW
ncbi:outer membrane autotransporter protein [Variovorax boronicumulans]|uniref:autotransporter outer membrane beta-barrel domain-containing protein n=1 Tax=Variovorax boronicumulans TaxID=436515 RepID=UPI00277F7CBB|nr:autotransporter outer membrane beta-barrel domain-containing protein [Variovorax boronicumulans]MDP9920741.1 outer membrane autotransporter protein [Variovorax boronicumulans]